MYSSICLILPIQINYCTFACTVRTCSCLHITDASVVIAPSHNYTIFENNVSMFTFNCSGNGVFILWTVDGQSADSSYVLNKGIRYTPFIVSPDGLTVSSQLIVPTTKANNNITVICIVLDSLFNHQSSNPVTLFLQGTVLIIYMYGFVRSL